MNNNNKIIQSICTLIDKKVSKLPYDKTFPSIVYGINSDGTYTIIKAGQKYNVKCALPNADIKLGTGVWVKIPCGRFHEMHICGFR